MVVEVLILKEFLAAFAKIDFKGPWLIEMWSHNKEDETLEENVQYIKEALEFFNNERKGIL